MPHQTAKLPSPTPQPSTRSDRRKGYVSETLRTLDDTAATAYILIMGSTGTGKSTVGIVQYADSWYLSTLQFINLVSGSNLRVGTGLHSQTATVELSKMFEHKSQRIVMVDTPGFDDTIESDTDVLITIASYLAHLYREGIQIRGIAYMHRITDNRMGGTALRNFRMFEAICGQSARQNAIIVLNMWDQVKKDIAEAREKELRESDLFFKPAVTAGTRTMRHWDNRESAIPILENLINQPSVALAIQREIVEERKAIHLTAAGLTLLGELAAKEANHVEELRRIREEREEARSRRDVDGELERDAEEAQKRLEDLRKKLVDEQRKLRNATTTSREVRVSRRRRAQSSSSCCNCCCCCC
ncbi:uncharacterized protein B0H18DRAFT_933679 [Fomitopsis serialis]|uniref:uncharacterized protein n=1 Tax=Fomitopsis serialis TaxID=139415 RepID=UPI002007A7B1|nr:uncharacterized protein B0H18DRAFT_933679 [Neoantrodia serialis]KAH9925224.1 hypothetical protein B0H18DRAFT_933679 [Neoantrodia serialis]